MRHAIIIVINICAPVDILSHDILWKLNEVMDKSIIPLYMKGPVCDCIADNQELVGFKIHADVTPDQIFTMEDKTVMVMKYLVDKIEKVHDDIMLAAFGVGYDALMENEEDEEEEEE